MPSCCNAFKPANSFVNRIMCPGIWLCLHVSKWGLSLYIIEYGIEPMVTSYCETCLKRLSWEIRSIYLTTENEHPNSYRTYPLLNINLKNPPCTMINWIVLLKFMLPPYAKWMFTCVQISRKCASRFSFCNMFQSIYFNFPTFPVTVLCMLFLALLLET